MRRIRQDLHTTGSRPHGAVRAAVAAASLAVAACFGAAISFAQAPAEPIEADLQTGTR